MSSKLAEAGLGPEQFSQLFAMIHAEVDTLKSKTSAFVVRPEEAALDAITDDIDQLGSYFDHLHALLESILDASDLSTVSKNEPAKVAAPIAEVPTVAAPTIVEAPAKKTRAKKVVDPNAPPKKLGRPRKVPIV